MESNSVFIDILKVIVSLAVCIEAVKLIVKKTSGVRPWLKKLLSKKDEFLDYSLENSEKYYKWEKNWLKSKKIKLPYLVTFNYKNSNSVSWGTYRYLNGETANNFIFPTEIFAFRDYFISLFKEKGRLGSQNNKCPRVSHFEISNDGQEFQLLLQNATYHDQVGTNLVLDADLNNLKGLPNSIKQRNLREWDIFQSQTKKGYLPTFKNSKLANTIGVAIGISAKNKNGEDVLIVRKRKGKIAVYPNTLHLPLTFALRKHDDLHEQGNLRDLILLDAKEEEMEELGFSLLKNGNTLKPLMFCRDLARGGKPQFFLEIVSKTSIESIKNLIKENPDPNEVKEFEDGIFAYTLPDAISKLESGKLEFSPELMAYICYKMK